MRRKFRAKAVVIRPKKIAAFGGFILIAAFAISHINVNIPYRAERAKVYLGGAVAAIGAGEERPARAGGPLDLLARSSVMFASATPISDGTQAKAELPDIDRPGDLSPSAAPKDHPAQSIPSEGLELRNQTSYSPDTAALVAANIDYLPVKKDDPQVLIVHTHTSEGYNPNERSGDESQNVVSIGNTIERILTERGVGVIHSKTVHDTNYNGSYGRSLETVTAILNENPGIRVVLDVHRDALSAEDGSSLRLVSDVNGKTAAQYMLVLGTDEGGLPHEGWQENLKFGLRLQQRMNDKYPGLARPLNLRKERFNQHMAPGMLIVECGASGNTMEEAQYGAELFSDCLAGILLGE